MATKKLTITLDEQQLEQVRKLVRRGAAGSVSGFVQRAVAIALQDAAGWEVLLDEALERSGGPITKDERRWADEILGPRKRRKTAA